jgi:hypothetical protein
LLRKREALSSKSSTTKKEKKNERIAG